MPLFHKVKIHYTKGMSEVISGCFVIKALTKRRLYIKVCAKIYDLQQELKSTVHIACWEVIQ